ncbi:hypothetical protein [Scytonema sp. NUACC21]
MKRNIAGDETGNFIFDKEHIPYLTATQRLRKNTDSISPSKVLLVIQKLAKLTRT